MLWESLLETRPVGIHDSFFELGGHSLLAVQVLARMRGELQKSPPLGSFFKAQTVAEMASLLGEEDQQEARYLVPIKTTGGHSPLFCFHAAGGEVLIYRALADALDAEVPVYGLRSQAVEGTLPEHESIEEMAREYALAIRKQQADGPYYLLGWSMGGAIAMAVAEELEHAGQQVAFVGLIDTYLTPLEDMLTQEVDPLHGLGLVIEAAMARTLVNPGQDEREALQANVLALSAQEQLPYVLAWGKERKVLPDSLSLEVLQSQAALARIHSALFHRYEAPTINAPLALWWAREPLHGAETQTRTEWAQYTRGGVHENVVDGNHFTMISPPHIQVVAQQLRNLCKISQDSQ